LNDFDNVGPHGTCYACCVCDSMADPDAVRLCRGVFACRDHSWEQIVGARAVHDRLRSVETSYYQETHRGAELLVWASHSLAEVRQEAPESLRMPDGTRILVLPDDACPDMFAVDGPLAGVLLSSCRYGRSNSP
jgi:hypothetical protein